ncbi:uncharacterized protein LOC119282037 [Triticum dicoccoides]|uniref:uncharacterized protein LOC119282037 n=1 Tax=Triticum dicoccoides TaxID=85692 RepID=UPI000843EC2F|nr:uncharacterized protein LOC119282037 [Triticum dicoccoides]XP_044345324.1 uncharacterized protein LOC123066275 [Triticum aestivum]
MMHYLYQQEIQRENRRRSLLLRQMEEGHAELLNWPALIQRGRYAHHLGIITRCATAVLGLAILIYVLVLKYKYHLPELQDPIDMGACVFVALCFIPSGYLCTQDYSISKLGFLFAC